MYGHDDGNMCHTRLCSFAAVRALLAERCHHRARGAARHYVRPLAPTCVFCSSFCSSSISRRLSPRLAASVCAEGDARAAEAVHRDALAQRSADALARARVELRAEACLRDGVAHEDWPTPPWSEHRDICAER